MPKLTSACTGCLFVQLIDFRALISLWTQDVVSFAWGLTSSLRARSLWHQHVVLNQHVPLCSHKPHSSGSRAPEKSWKGHLAMEVKGMSFRDSQTSAYSLFILSSLKDGYCPYRWKQYLYGLSDKEGGVSLCGTVTHSVSPKMPLSLSSGKERNSTTVMNRWSRSLSFSRASNMTSALWVSKVSCS